MEIVVQVNGKIADRAMVSKEMNEADMQALALELDKVREAMGGKTVRKVIAVKGKLVNIVVG